MNGDVAFDLEDHSRSIEIAFARCGSPISYQSRASGAQIEVIPLELDFVDFDRLRGDRQVLASFDLGIVILHELAHAALRLNDARTREEGPGDCENYINKIRRDLDLPERQQYFARLIERSTGSTSGASSKIAELLFRNRRLLMAAKKNPSSSAGKPRRSVRSTTGRHRTRKAGTMAMQRGEGERER
jgi:hypothetical protein